MSHKTHMGKQTHESVLFDNISTVQIWWVTYAHSAKGHFQVMFRQLQFQTSYSVLRHKLCYAGTRPCSCIL